ncbi:MAG: carbohydrate kinase family protein [Actinomycetota bacterium]|nr:carbohydrate kinase family protein [Actinomycetota bacterium]
MSRLGVVGNISIDHSHRAGLPGLTSIGGAALHVSLAAARARFMSRPLSVVGHDLDVIRHDSRLGQLDLSGVKILPGTSAVFTLTYDRDGVLVDAEADYGTSTRLTDHALEHIHARSDDSYHVCCRRPLDIAKVLDALVLAARPFSVDFFLSSAAESIAAAAGALPLAQVVFANAAEYELLTDAVPVSALRDVVVTDGPRPAQLIRSGRRVARALPPRVDPVDVTGSGDTVAGTFLAARATGLEDAVALEWAMRAASAHAASAALRLDK